MPTAPSARMRSRADAWLNDSVTLTAVTVAEWSRGAGSVPVETLSGTVTVAALVRPVTVDVLESESVERSARDLTVWVPDATTSDVVAGWRCTIVTCQDATLVGKVAEVVTVDRDSLAVIRRLTVRLGNDA